MQLPFVSRERFEMMRDLLTAANGRETHWEQMFTELMGKYDALVLRQHPEPVKLPERTKDDVIEAILQKSRGDGRLRAHLAGWAMQQRKAGVSDDTIIPMILTWSSPEDEDSPV